MLTNVMRCSRIVGDAIQNGWFHLHQRVLCPGAAGVREKSW
jgi:hypothetical protein